MTATIHKRRNILRNRILEDVLCFAVMSGVAALLILGPRPEQTASRPQHRQPTDVRPIQAHQRDVDLSAAERLSKNVHYASTLMSGDRIRGSEGFGSWSANTDPMASPAQRSFQ